MVPLIITGCKINGRAINLHKEKHFLSNHQKKISVFNFQVLTLAAARKIITSTGFQAEGIING